MADKGQRSYIAIDLKSFYASVECKERELDPMTTNLVVADKSRTEKTICLAVSPSLKSYGIPGRARLFEVVQKVKEVNKRRICMAPGKKFAGASVDNEEIKLHPELGTGLYYGGSENGIIYEMQYGDLQHLSEIRCTGGYPCLFH